MNLEDFARSEILNEVFEITQISWNEVKMKSFHDCTFEPTDLTIQWREGIFFDTFNAGQHVQKGVQLVEVFDYIIAIMEN